jgi:hypothetical protein
MYALSRKFEALKISSHAAGSCGSAGCGEVPSTTAIPASVMFMPSILPASFEQWKYSAVKPRFLKIPAVFFMSVLLPVPEPPFM